MQNAVQGWRQQSLVLMMVYSPESQSHKISLFTPLNVFFFLLELLKDLKFNKTHHDSTAITDFLH